MMQYHKALALRFLLCLSALLLSSVCYLYGIGQPVRGSAYTGMRAINASDYNVNLSWIQQFREGHFLLKNLFTSEPHHGFLVRPLYYLVTLPFLRLPLSNNWILHLARLLCGLVLLLFLFRLFATFGTDSRTTTIAFLLIAFSSGAGILLRRWIPNPADLGVPESTLFLTLGEPPHFLYSLLLFWIGIAAFYLISEARSGALPTFFLALILLWWEHPFDAITLSVVAVISVWQLRSFRLRILVPAGIISIAVPPLLYYDALQKIPAFSGWSAQNVMLSPSFFSMLSAFLPLVILGIPGATHVARTNKKLLAFLLTWIATQFLLAYLPFSFQRRLIAGVQFPLALLAAYGLGRIRQVSVIAAILLICASGNILVTRQQVQDLRSMQMPFYLPLEYQDAFQWLDSQKEKGTTLSGFVTGNFIPAYTGFSVYLGHSALTPGIADKRERLARFYRNPEQEFLKQNNIQYIFWGLEERQLSNLSLERLFDVAYQRGAVFILKAGRLQPNDGVVARTSFAPRPICE